MTGSGIVGHAIDCFQLCDASKGFLAKGMFALECVQNDPFEEITQRDVIIFSQRFEDFHQILLHARANLHPLNGNDLLMRLAWFFHLLYCFLSLSIGMFHCYQWNIPTKKSQERRKDRPALYFPAYCSVFPFSCVCLLLSWRNPSIMRFSP